MLKRLARADDLDDMVTQVMTATCGVTVNLALPRSQTRSDRDFPRVLLAVGRVCRRPPQRIRDANAAEVRELAERKQTITTEWNQVKAEIARRAGQHFDLADIVGGGNGQGTGKPGNGIDQLSGNVQVPQRALVEGIKPNTLVALERQVCRQRGRARRQ